MTLLQNIDATSQADVIGNDAQPTLKLVNTSTGPGLLTLGLVATSTASIDKLYVPTIESASTTAAALTVRKTVPGNMSIGTLRISGNSLASGAVLEFYEKGFASITSVVLTSVANTDYAIRVQVGTETRWIPLFKDAAIIGAATFA